jgi:hypothetical protein
MAAFNAGLVSCKLLIAVLNKSPSKKKIRLSFSRCFLLELWPKACQSNCKAIGLYSPLPIIASTIWSMALTSSTTVAAVRRHTHQAAESNQAAERPTQITQEQSPSSSRAEAVRALAMRLQQSDYHSALLADELLRTQAAAAAAAQAYGACNSATSISPVSFASPPPAAVAAAAAAAAAVHTRVSIDTTAAAPAAIGSSAGPGSCSSSASIRERLERLLHQRAEGDSSLVYSEEQQQLVEAADDDDPFVSNCRSPQQQLPNGHATAARTRSSTVQLQQRSVAMLMSLALRSIVKARLNNCWHRWRQVSWPFS